MGNPPYFSVIHLVPNPLAAARFVEPLVVALEHKGIIAELWTERGNYEFVAQRLKLPIKWHSFSLRWNPVAMALGFMRLYVALKKSQPTAIEAHFTRGALIPLLAARLARVKIRIYHNHGIPYLGYKRLTHLLLKFLEWINIRLSTHVVTVSRRMHETYMQDGLLGTRECVVFGPGSACGIDLQNYPLVTDSSGKTAAKDRLGLASFFVVIYVGRPNKRKGFHLILKTWARYFPDSSDMKLLLAGIDGHDVENLLGKVGENVKPLGFVEDLRCYYDAADVVVLPSEHEGFGYALLEGAASGCCMIASNIPGPDALLKHGINGFSIEPGDAKSLVMHIIKLRDDPQKRREMSVAARRTAEKFSREPIIASYTDFFLKVLQESA